MRCVGKSLIIAAALAMVTPTCEAQVLNWLFPLRPYRQAQRQAARNGTVAFYPTTAAACSNCSTTAPCSTCATNTTYYGGFNAGGTNYGSGGYYPTYGSWQGAGQTPVTSCYAPTTTYRTVLTPVPVTTYSPIAGGNCQQACTSYSWQARRIPYVAYQPTYATAPACGASSGCNACSSCATTAFSAGGFQPVATSTGLTTPACSSCQATTTVGYPSSTSSFDGSMGRASEWTPVSSSSDGSCSSCNAAASAPANTYANYPSTESTRSTGYASEWQPVASSSAPSTERDLQPVPADDPPRLDDAQESYRPRLDAEPEEDSDSTWRPVSPPQNARRQPPRHRTDDELDFARSEYYRYHSERSKDVDGEAMTNTAQSSGGRDRDPGQERLVGDHRSQLASPASSYVSRAAETSQSDKYRDRLDDGSWSYDGQAARLPSHDRYDWRAADDWDREAQTNYRPLGSTSDDEGQVVPSGNDLPSTRPYASPVQLIPDPSREAAAGSPDGYGRTVRLASSDRWEARPISSRPATSLEGWQAAD